MTAKEFLNAGFAVLDGAMGTALQKAGLAPGEKPETWALTHRDAVRAVHKAYFDAGADMVLTDTFGLNRFRFAEEEIEKIVFAAVGAAREAGEASRGPGRRFVGLDVGPLGRMLKPLGDTDPEEAVSVFGQVMRLGEKAGADLIFIETMNDLAEARAAVLAAKEYTRLPVVVSNAYGTDGRLLTGADPETVVTVLEGLGADALGVNCSFGPAALGEILDVYLRCASVPVLAKPNAGLPRVENGETVYDVGPEAFCEEMRQLVRKGVRLAGGCCGTDPRYIAGLRALLDGETPVPVTKKDRCAIASARRALVFGEDVVPVGERLNPTGKKRLKAALAAGDLAYVLEEALRQEEAGAMALDVNVGAPEVDEKVLLPRVIAELQTVTDLPLQPDTADPVAMEKALRVYVGKALINSVSGKRESMDAVFPLARKYGGVVIALTLDENGVPATAEGRLAVAKKILDAAAEYGLTKNDLIFDPLALAVSADPAAARETLSAVRTLRKEWGCRVSLGVSNVSFGLPERSGLNAAFFTLAMEAGLSAAIINPLSGEMMRAMASYRALMGRDEGFRDYLSFAERFTVTEKAPPAEAGAAPAASIRDSVRCGLRERAAALTRDALATRSGLDLIREEIVPALDKVGADFENHVLYLPQLLMAAEAASAAFEEIRRAPEFAAAPPTGPRVVLATVKGDVHDIGKNIVRLLLENFGFAVTDLGKDVPPETVVEAALREKAAFVGLSALMTTTVPAMEETIRLLRRAAPGLPVVVGGAVLTEEYARAIGADFYAKDAMETVRFAERLRDEKGSRA